MKNTIIAIIFVLLIVAAGWYFWNKYQSQQSLGQTMKLPQQMKDQGKEGPTLPSGASTVPPEIKNGSKPPQYEDNGTPPEGAAKDGSTPVRIKLNK